jgi:hypothetical protein
LTKKFGIGTNYNVEISQSGINEMAFLNILRNAFRLTPPFIISTHLHQLKEMEEISNGKVATYFIECGLQNNIPAFTYKLRTGWSDLKLGRILFEREGLNNLLG